MAENLGDKFATMSEDERRQFAMDPERSEEGAAELEFDDPRSDPGRTKASLEDRDGAGALVDDKRHEKRVEMEARARAKRKQRTERQGG